MHELIFQSPQIAHVEAPLYFYFVRAGSTTQSPWSLKELDRLYAYLNIMDYFGEHPSDIAYHCAVLGVVYNLVDQYKKIHSSNLRFTKKWILLIKLRMLFYHTWSKSRKRPTLSRARVMSSWKIADPVAYKVYDFGSGVVSYLNDVLQKILRK